MARSPIADRFLNDVYWRSRPSVPVSEGASAVARMRLYLFKDGGRTTKPDDLLKGRELGNKIVPYIDSVEIEEDEEMTTKLTLNLVNVGRLLSQNDIINEGDACFIDFGYGQQFFNLNHRFVFIRSHPAFTRDGIPSIKYIGYDGRFAMISADFLVNKRSRQLAGGALIKGRRQGIGQSPSTFKNQTDDQIIDRIAYHYGFSIDVDPIPGRKTRVKKKKTSDWEFVRKIAKKIGYTAWVDWDDLNQTYCIHYRKKEGVFKDGYTFHYGSATPQDIRKIEKSTYQNDSPIGTLLDFHPTLDTSRMTTDIEVIRFDRYKSSIDREWESYLDKSLPLNPVDPDAYDFGETVNNGFALKLKVGGRVITTLSNKPFKNKKQAREFAFNLVNQFQADFMTGRGTVIGVQDLRPRQIHRLLGIDRYSGDYYFTQVSHKFTRDNFYENGFVCYRLLDQKIASLIRRGQITQSWAAPLITRDDGIIYPGAQ